MYKFIFVLLVVVGMATASNAQEKQNMKQSDNKPLVAYFSVTGTTARAAEKLAGYGWRTLCDNPCRIVYKCRSRLE